MSERLPQLLDRRQLAAELGQSISVAETLMAQLPKVRIGRRVFVKRTQVAAYLRDQELTAEGFAA